MSNKVSFRGGDAGDGGERTDRRLFPEKGYRGLVCRTFIDGPVMAVKQNLFGKGAKWIANWIGF